MSKALELRKEYEAKLAELEQKRLDAIELKVNAYRENLLATDESYKDDAMKINAVIDEIDKVIAEEDALAAKLDKLAQGEVKGEVIMMGPIVGGDVPEVESKTEVAESKPAEVRRPGMPSIFRR